MEEGVRKRQVCTGSNEGESVGVAVSNPVFAEDALPEIMIITDSDVEVAKGDQFII